MRHGKPFHRGDLTLSNQSHSFVGVARCCRGTAALAAAALVLLSPGLADAVIFQDGFESGDANAWSAVVPIHPLLFSELSVRPDEAEFLEIGNPNPVDIELENIYIADYNLYYLITIGGGAPGIADFRVQFPASAIISAHDVVVVSVRSAADFS